MTRHSKNVTTLRAACAMAMLLMTLTHHARVMAQDNGAAPAKTAAEAAEEAAEAAEDAKAAAEAKAAEARWKEAEHARWNTAEKDAVPIADGGTVRQWIALQSSRTQASRTRQTVSGPVMNKIHDRYLDSFARSIPDRLRDDMPSNNR